MVIQYQQMYRPAYAGLAQAPAGGPVPAVPPVPARGPAPLTSNQRTMAIALGSAETAFGALSTWVGVRAGLREKGIFSILGWAVAAGGGLFTVVNLLGTVGMISRTVEV